MKIKNILFVSFKVGILIIWMGMMYVLVKNNYAPKKINNKFDTTHVDNSLVKDEWMGIYFKNEKIGYSHWMMIPDKDKNVYIVDEQSYMAFTAGKEHINMRIKNNAVIDSNFRLKDFTAYLFSAMYNLKIEGKMDGNEFKIRMSSDKSVKNISIPVEEIPLITSNINQIISSKGLIPGSNYIFPYYDPFTLTNKRMSVHVEKKDQVEIYGKTEQAYKIREDYDGIIVYAWLKEDGTRLREESPMGFVLKRERQDDALNVLDKNEKIDLIKSTRVVSEKHIENPREITYLKLELSGIDLNGFPLLNQGRQRINGNILEIFNLPFKENKTGRADKFLASSLFIQSDDPLIKDKADEIAGNEKDSLKKAELITKWLNQNLKKRVTVSVPDAVSILKTKTGDCNEHATLFTALARAAALPSKICVGLVYSGDGFFYHAWNEVFARNEWISVDSVFGQIPADAAHVKFIEGELAQQMDILKIIGQIHIKILEYK
ncbi:MAG: transglutaminase-like domain-containing protein [bacterium]